MKINLLPKSFPFNSFNCSINVFDQLVSRNTWFDEILCHYLGRGHAKCKMYHFK